MLGSQEQLSRLFCPLLSCHDPEMAPKKRLSYGERVKIQVLMDEGYSLAAIAEKVKCSHSCVSKTLLRVKETGTLKDRKRIKW